MAPITSGEESRDHQQASESELPGTSRTDWNVDGPSAVGAGASFGFIGSSGSPQSSIQQQPFAEGATDGKRDVGFKTDMESPGSRSKPGFFHPMDWPESEGSWPEPQAMLQSPALQVPSMPHADLVLPIPTLAIDFRMAVALNPRVSVGVTPLGHRNWISFVGGSWAASWGSGSVLPGGQDSQIIVANGSARIETTYLLQTNDREPAFIVVKTEGWRTGSPEVLAALADPARADNVDPRSYSFRLFIRLETGDERYADKINYSMWIGSGMRKDREVIYDAYRVN